MSEAATVVGAVEVAAELTATPSAWRPYAPSWVNAITAWVDRLPGPAWPFA